jgi:hypothetical protein
MTIDIATALKALGAETSGTDGAGTALDLGGPWGLIYAEVRVTAVAGSPTPSQLDLQFEGSSDNVHFYGVSKVVQLTTPGLYRVPIYGVESTDRITTTDAAAFRAAPRYLRKNSTVTAGSADGVTYSIHLTA